MATDPEPSIDAKVRGSVARTFGNLVFLLVVLAALGAYAWLGTYQLEPGQAAIITRLGKYVETLSEPGLHFHFPAPFEGHEIVNVAEIERQEFGFRGSDETSARELLEASMQTGDNNIVYVSFVVRYRNGDAFASRYRLAEPIQTLRDAAQAAVREVVGQMTIDNVISEGRGDIEPAAEERLQMILDEYGSGFLIDGVELQEVQPPQQVREAFDDVIAAAQDGSRSVNEAEGYRNEVLPQARAEATEAGEQAAAYSEAKIARADGDAQRFSALAHEYHKAPEVTRIRLYLETMEMVLPSVQKVIIEPGSTQLLPYLPIRREPRSNP